MFLIKTMIYKNIINQGLNLSSVLEEDEEE
jgi:hypothetical protein